MSAKSVFKMGFLSMIAATGLFGASNGFAADAREATDTTVAVSNDFKIQVTPGGSWKVVDSKGNVYLLTELKDGKAPKEHLYSYTKPTSH
ncbi:MAG: hypothetical protein ACREIJ_09955 [Nitrospiraceae bacterium]